MVWDPREVILHRAEDYGSFRSELLGSKSIQLCCLEAKMAVDDILGGLVLPDYDVVIDTVAQILILQKEALLMRPHPRILLLAEIKAVAFAVYQMYSTKGWAESKLDYSRRIL